MAGLLVSGCAARYADVPAPTRFENSTQQKLQATAHWRKIAEHFAEAISANLKGRLSGRMLHVPQPEGEQVFVAGFRELLVTELVNRGVPVTTVAEGAMTLDIAYSIQKFSADRAAATHHYGEATVLASGLWAFGEILASPVLSHGAKVVLGVAGVEGGFRVSQDELHKGKYASGPVPRSEIILTASILDRGVIVSRHSNIYYSADEDSALYWQRPSQGRALKVSGS